MMTDTKSAVTRHRIRLTPHFSRDKGISVDVASADAASQPLSRAMSYAAQQPDVHSRVAIDEHTLHGVPRIVGTRIPVWTLLRLLAEGFDLTQIAVDYSLSPEDISAGLRFAAHVLDPDIQFDTLSRIDSNQTHYEVRPIENDFTTTTH
jgi:uncharacterized protein (DUF433 family)